MKSSKKTSLSHSKSKDKKIPKRKTSSVMRSNVLEPNTSIVKSTDVFFTSSQRDYKK